MLDSYNGHPAAKSQKMEIEAVSWATYKISPVIFYNDNSFNNINIIIYVH